MDWVGLLGRVLMSAIFIWRGYNKAAAPTARFPVQVMTGLAYETVPAVAAASPL